MHTRGWQLSNNVPKLWYAYTYTALSSKRFSSLGGQLTGG